MSKPAIGIFLVAFILRLAYVAVVPGLGKTLPEDYREYIVSAQRLLERGTMVSPFIIEDVSDVPSCVMPPGYTALVAGAYWALGIETFGSTLAIHLFHALGTSLAAVLVYLLARSLSGSLAAWLSALLVVINPAIIRYTGYIWDTSVFTLGITLVVWLAYCMSHGSQRLVNWLAFGLLLGLLALINPALTIGYPFLVLWSLTRSASWRWRQILRPVCAVMCGWLLAVTPWTVRNYAHFNKLTYIRCGLGMQLWLGVCPEASAQRGQIFHSQFPLMGAEPQRRLLKVGEGAYLDDCMRRSIEAIRVEPWRFARLIALRTLDYWGGTVFSHRSPEKGGWPSSPLRAMGAVFLMSEGIMVVAGLVFIRRLSPDLRWLLAVAVSFSLVYCITHVEVRYRTPCEPIIAIITGLLIGQIWRSLPRRQRQEGSPVPP
jgi:4-amino-4-deoxy-L-arabinose transferase-like glycosyltransferase